MKKSLAISKSFAFLCFSLLLLFSSIDSDAQYKVNKKIYDYADYTTEMYGPYSPLGAGFASLLIPGTGQMLSGEVGRGFIFLGADVVSFMLLPVGFLIGWGAVEELGIAMMLTGVAGVFTTHIWAAVDAGRVAKVNNLAELDLQSKGTSWRLSPELKFLPNMEAAPSLTLSYKF